MEKELKAKLFDEFLEILSKHKIIQNNFVRNDDIRAEYKALRDEGKAGKEAREILAQKYFCSIKNIEAILYGKRKEEKENCLAASEKEA